MREKFSWFCIQGFFIFIFMTLPRAPVVIMGVMITWISTQGRVCLPLSAPIYRIRLCKRALGLKLGCLGGSADLVWQRQIKGESNLLVVQGQVGGEGGNWGRVLLWDIIFAEKRGTIKKKRTHKQRSSWKLRFVKVQNKHSVKDGETRFPAD